MLKMAVSQTDELDGECPLQSHKQPIWHDSHKVIVQVKLCSCRAEIPIDACLRNAIVSHECFNKRVLFLSVDR